MRLTFVSGGDWEVVYRDGNMLIEGHSISGHQLAQALEDDIGLQVENFAVDGTDWDEEVAAMTGFPDAFEDIPKEALR